MKKERSRVYFPEKEPTIRQAQVLEIFNKLSRYEWVRPSVREIAKELRVNSPATVHAHLNALREKGWI